MHNKKLFEILNSGHHVLSDKCPEIDDAPAAADFHDDFSYVLSQQRLWQNTERNKTVIGRGLILRTEAEHPLSFHNTQCQRDFCREIPSLLNDVKESHKFIQKGFYSAETLSTDPQFKFNKESILLHYDTRLKHFKDVFTVQNIGVRGVDPQLMKEI